MIQAYLADASSGDHCVVLEIASKPAGLKSRLYALGVIPGSTLDILRFAPLGDPIQVKVRGTFISIRKADAEVIKVKIQ
jgi:ferrous iron transport protein A